MDLIVFKSDLLQLLLEWHSTDQLLVGPFREIWIEINVTV